MRRVQTDMFQTIYLPCIVIQASLFLANRVFFCSCKRGRRRGQRQISGRGFTAIVARQSAPDISGLYFRYGLTRHGSTVAVSLSAFRSLSLFLSLSSSRPFPRFHSTAGIKAVKVKTQLPPELNKAYLNERHNRPFYFA